MNALLTISARGQVTLPEPLRRKLGLKGGDLLALEDREGRIVLKPQAVFERYEDDQIEQWDVEDQLDSEERRRIIEASRQPGS